MHFSPPHTPHAIGYLLLASTTVTHCNSTLFSCGNFEKLFSIAIGPMKWTYTCFWSRGCLLKTVLYLFLYTKFNYRPGMGRIYHSALEYRRKKDVCLLACLFKWVGRLNFTRLLRTMTATFTGNDHQIRLWFFDPADLWFLKYVRTKIYSPRFFYSFVSKRVFWSSLVTQKVKDLVLLLLWHGFDPWPGSFHMLQMHQKIIKMKLFFKKEPSININLWNSYAWPYKS